MSTVLLAAALGAAYALVWRSALVKARRAAAEQARAARLARHRPLTPTVRRIADADLAMIVNVPSTAPLYDQVTGFDQAAVL